LTVSLEEYARLEAIAKAQGLRAPSDLLETWLAHVLRVPITKAPPDQRQPRPARVSRSSYVDANR
jgi:hypothetical protein